MLQTHPRYSGDNTMKLAIPFAMIFAALTENQSGIVLGCLVFVVILLVIGVVKMFQRLGELEDVVYKSSDKVEKLHAAVFSIHDKDSG